MKARRWVIAVLLFVVAGWIVALQVAAQNLTEEAVRRAGQKLVDDGDVDGLSIGFLEGERFGIVHVGKAQEGETGPANFETLYELGSVSKVFTSLLLADAVAREEIDLYANAEAENRAGLKLPALRGRAIRWLDLSTHRSGLPRLPSNLNSTGLTDPYRDYDSKQAAAFVNGYELPREPGQAHEYSNFGASVLGYLLAERAGKTYDELLRERIAGPLEMTDCVVKLSPEQEARLATPHSRKGTVASRWNFADLPGAGGVHATMRDMMRFAKAQLKPPSGPIGEAIELAWKQHSDADDSGPATGLGWMIAGDGQTRWHNGRTGGFTSALFLHRESQSAVIVLSNTSVDKVDGLAVRLLQQAAGVGGAEPAGAPGDDKADDEADDDRAGQVVIDAKLRRRLEGRYQLAPTFIFTVRDRDGHLMVGITDQPTQEVFADSPTRWSYRGVEATLEFQLPKTGRARSLILHQNGMQQVARRID